MQLTANIYIWGEHAGAVAWNEETRISTFEYSKDIISRQWDLAPVKMPLNLSNRIFSFPELWNLDAFRGLPGLLSDTLPDRYGNRLINGWLARQGRPENSYNPVELLCFIGTRSIGALEFEPVLFQSNKRAFNIEMDSLIEVTQKMLNIREGFKAELSQSDDEAMREILRIGTSAGGARPKAIIAYNEKTGEVKSGQTTAPAGFSHWLIKLDGVSDDQFGKTTGFGRVEMAYYNMAIASGIDMMESRLHEESGRAHFMTRRFDREGNDVKHHVQTLCAMQHYDYNDTLSYSYEQLFQTMRILRLPYPQAEQLYRRMVFNVIARNCDDHTKNFSFLLKRDQEWELSPAYDVCHAYRPGSEWVSQHALSINGKRTGIKRDDLLSVAQSMNIKKADSIIKEIDMTVSKWPEYAEEVHVNPELRDKLNDTLISYM
ncbi:MAG: type II toxin-antitoxin system HipA family toxin [Desulfatiglans sp.]|jgi:serine/threonine-protein kinase HipA|nr:type II toxin-antitoxin system HipA family toxin [Desulfatiglans sp.]